MTYNLFWV